MSRAAIVVVILLHAGRAFAQAAPDQTVKPGGAATTPAPRGLRGYVVGGASLSPSGNDFRQTRTFTANAEDGTFLTDYAVKGGTNFELAAGVAIWRVLGVQVSASRSSVETGATLTAAVAHPFFFARARNVSGEIAGLKRDELTVGIHASWVFHPTSRLQAVVSAGPTWLQVKQGFVTDFRYTDAYPYDTATFTSGVTSIRQGDKVSIGAGGGLHFFVTRRLGVAATAQFAGGDVSMTNTTETIKAGGVRGGIGVVLRY